MTALCRNPEKTDITALKNIEKELAEFYEKGSFDKYFLCDMHFHKKLVELAGNGCMADLHEILINRYTVVRHTTGMILVHSKEACEEHAAMIQAMEAHDEEKAREIMRGHIIKMEARLNEKVTN